MVIEWNHDGDFGPTLLLLIVVGVIVFAATRC